MRPFLQSPCRRLAVVGATVVGQVVDLAPTVFLLLFGAPLSLSVLVGGVLLVLITLPQWLSQAKMHRGGTSYGLARVCSRQTDPARGFRRIG